MANLLAVVRREYLERVRSKAFVIGTILFAFLSMASRIYRVGILMHGKRPTFAELRRWLRRA